MNWNILGFRILSAVAASLSIINLLKDLNAINIYGSLDLWVHFYSAFVDYVFDCLFYWIKLPYFSISTVERHAIVVDSILIGAIFRDSMTRNILGIRNPEGTIRKEARAVHFNRMRNDIQNILMAIAAITIFHGFLSESFSIVAIILPIFISSGGFTEDSFGFVRSLLEIFAIFLCVIALNYLIFG